MSTGLRQELGLGERQTQGASAQGASPQGSAQQADQFRANFQPQIDTVNSCLQYTAAHAETTIHEPQTTRRESVCSAYQVALGRIDPTNPAAAQGAIDQVVAAVQGLATAIDTVRQGVERAYNAWTSRESDLDDVTDKIREMVEWGHERAATLQQIVDVIASKANLRKWEEALQALEQLLGRVTPIYEEFLRQKAAQEEYEPAVAALEPQLAETSTCEFASLEARQQEITAAADEMRQAAETKDFVTALERLRSLDGLVSEYLAEVERLRAAREEYEQARAALEPRLTEASTSEHASLAELDQQIADLTARTDQAASAGEYEQALQLLNQLSAAVDRKLSEAGRIDRRIIGSAQQSRADRRLESLDEENRERFNRLAEAAQSPAELDYLTQTLAANHSMDDIETFAERIRGQDDEWMQNNLRLTGNSDGEGVMQQWETSCNATAAQAVRGQLDPVYALRLHDENVDVTIADDSDATAVNPALAEEQRAMLESTYSGTAHAPHTGVADNRDGAAGTSDGRFADDLMNDMSDSTGVRYSYQGVGGGYSADDVVTDVETGVRQGHPVPLVVGGPTADGGLSTAHYVLVTGSNPGPPPTWTVHDPWDGITVERTVEDMRTGNVNLAGHTHISGMENPSAVE